MSDRSIRKLSQLIKSSHFPGLQWVAQGIFKAYGYRWETRRSGDLKMGYWRRTLKTQDRKLPYPKRLVLLPGFGDSPLSWHVVMVLLSPVLKKEFDEVILFDFPGFGGVLTKEKAFPSADLMFAATCDALDSLKPHTLIGHSLGGWLAAHYAALCGNKERPKSNQLNYSGPSTLLLFCPSGIFPDIKTRIEFEDIFRRSQKGGFQSLRPYLFSKEPAWFGWVLPFLGDFLKREDIVQFLASFRMDHSLETMAGQIKANVWLIWGEKDLLVPPSCIPAWLQLLPHQTDQKPAVILRKIGHTPQLESAGVTAALIAQILSGRIPHRLGKRWWTLMQPPTLPVNDQAP
ncbi:MAG: alpha/beta hydrolase [Bdellovibrionia bacterium]